MNKFNDTTIYFANLIAIKNGIKTPYKENACLLYRSERDCFYSLENTFNEFLWFEDKQNPRDEEKENFYQSIEKYSYSYTPLGQEGEIYVDINSIKILENGDVNGKTRK